MTSVFHIYDDFLKTKYNEHEVVHMLRDAGNFFLIFRSDLRFHELTTEMADFWTTCSFNSELAGFSKYYKKSALN